MKIVLSGVETHNKGAELMLYAILQEIERRYPAATVYLPVDGVRQGKKYIETSLKLKYKPVDFWFRIAQRCRWNGLMYRLGWLNMMVLDVWSVKNSEYFIDGSGLLFSDQQKLSEIEVLRWEKLLSRQKKEKTKIIFLPQAFGPIEKAQTKSAIKILDQYADVVMPREQTSYDYLADSGLINVRKLHRFSDFTSLVHSECPSAYRHLEGQVCIIPNKRMVDKKIIKWEDYLRLLRRMVETVYAQGKKAYLLNHEGIGDELIAKRISNALPYPVEVVTGLNALDTKGVISVSYAVISSRFHGVASALNTCVPCLATSWNHKYAALFKDYGLNDCVLPITNEETCLSMIKTILEPKENIRIRKSLLAIQPEIQQQTREMWSIIWNYGK